MRPAFTGRRARLRLLAIVVFLVVCLSPVFAHLTSAGGVGISDPPCNTGGGAGPASANSIDTIPFHVYKIPDTRAAHASRDFEFLWSDTYRSRFHMPLDTLTGPPEKRWNDMDRLGESVADLPGANPFSLDMTDIELAYNLLAMKTRLKDSLGQLFDRSASYDRNVQHPVGFRVAQSLDPDKERNHIDAYIYGRSFNGYGQWASYLGDGNDGLHAIKNYGLFPSGYKAAGAEDSLTGNANTPFHQNAVQIPGPLPSQVGGTSASSWTRSNGPGCANLVHESVHALNNELGGFLHMFASGAEALTGVSTDPAANDVDYHYSLSPSAGSPGNAYPHWQSFMAWLLFNWRGTDTSVNGWSDDLVKRWAANEYAERDFYSLARRLRDSECAECASYPGFAGLDSLARVQRLVHDWRVASYVNSPTLAGGRYGFPTQFGFSPGNQLRAWQSVDTDVSNDQFAIPPEVTLSSADLNRSRWMMSTPDVPGRGSRPLRMSMYGAEYFVFRAGQGVSGPQHRLLVRVRSDSLVCHELKQYMTGSCAPRSSIWANGRLTASLVSYSQASATDELWRHPEWATSIQTKSALLDSALPDMEFEVSGFGTMATAALLVVTLGDGHRGYFSTTDKYSEAADQFPIAVGATLFDGTAVIATQPIAAAAEPEDSPAWSPDGTKLAYVRQETLGQARIYLRSAVGTGPETPLRSASNGQHDPAWSPRGDAVAYAEGGESTRRLWQVDLAAGTASALTSDNGFVHSPAYSPNGSRIAYLREWTVTTWDSLPRDSTTGVRPVREYGWDVRLRDLAAGWDSLIAGFADSSTVRALRWAPNGRTFSFYRYSAALGRYQRYEVDPRTRTVTTPAQLTPGELMREVPPGSGRVLLEEDAGLPYLVACEPLDVQFCHCHPDTQLVPARWMALRDTVARKSTPIGY